MIGALMQRFRWQLFILVSGAVLWILSPAACGPPTGQVKHDWEVFVANRDECLRTVKLEGIAVGDRHVHLEQAEVEIAAFGRWRPGHPDPGWFTNTPCKDFHGGSEAEQIVPRTLVYVRHNLIGWEIDLWRSFMLEPGQTMGWDWKKEPREPVTESPENLAR